MRNLKGAVSLILVVIMVLAMAMGAYANSTVIVKATGEFWGDGGEVFDILAITNVAKELPKKSFSEMDNPYMKSVEVSGSAFISSLADAVYFEVENLSTGKITTPAKDFYTIEESGYSYYGKGAFVNINEPGEYLITAVYDGLDLFTVAYIKVVAEGKSDTSGSANNVAGALSVKTVKSTSAQVIVNGAPIQFEAYNIDGNNYFKLRDLAKAVNGSEKQFDIVWDGILKKIRLISNTKYYEVGGELVPGDGKAKLAQVSKVPVFKDDTQVELTAYTITNNNYFKLRDIAKLFNIGVTWDNKTKTIGINTKEGYTE